MPAFISEYSELYWFDCCPFLHSAGYKLRPKFYPGFVATKEPSPMLFGDELTTTHMRTTIMDAVRIPDDRKVMLKRISKTTHPFEIEIATLFGSPAATNDPRNHCIPILDVLQDPVDADKQIIVMPRFINFDRPIFDTVGEVVACFQQIFEGILYMHENFVAHRDCGRLNVLLDPSDLFPYGTHPVNDWANSANDGFASHTTRTACWPRYYIIDFGLSRRYDPALGPPLEDIIYAADKTPPEHAGNAQACNPFPTDIYLLGNLLRREFIGSDWLLPNGTGRRNHGPLRFLKPLVKDMTQEDPELRPTIGEVIQRFDALCARLSQWHLRRPGQAVHPFLWIQHRVRQIQNTFKRVPPLPPRSPTRTPIVLDDAMRAFYTKTPVRNLTRDIGERSVRLLLGQ
ncbi:hypothetical protein C8R43DRAFT_1065410 [Mycena crocata]|nr:hypothetical protein C8R43DRAFT_1065410 [Mycena crocata]